MGPSTKNRFMNYKAVLTLHHELKLIMIHSFPLIFNPLTTNVPHHIETSQLICIANQLNGFYMKGNTDR